MKLDDTQIALICLLIIAIICVVTQMEGAKDVALTISGGIVGYLSKTLSTPSLAGKNTDEKEG